MKLIRKLIMGDEMPKPSEAFSRAEEPSCGTKDEFGGMLDELRGQNAALRSLEDDMALVDASIYQGYAHRKKHYIAYCAGLDYDRRLPFRRLRNIAESAARNGIADDMRSLVDVDAVLLGRGHDGRDAYAALTIAVRGGPRETGRSRRAAEYLSRATGARALPVLVSARIHESVADEVVDSETLGPERRAPEDKVIWVRMTMSSRPSDGCDQD